MFDLPEAKPVRRSDLYAHSASSSPPPCAPDPKIEAQLRARLAELYGNATLSSAPEDEFEAIEEAEVPETEDEVFEFRLFEGKAEGEGVEAQRIVLRDEVENLGEGGFVMTRDPRVFTVQKAEGERKRGLELMALTGEDVMHAAGKRAWGLEVPWRVKVIRVVGKKTPNDSKAVDGKAVVDVDGDGEAKKRRPGKKRRIILRQKKKAKEELAEKKKEEQLSKEEVERDKKTRRNREKKVKRRLKEKEEKAKKTDGTFGVGNTVTKLNPDAPKNLDN